MLYHLLISFYPQFSVLNVTREGKYAVLNLLGAIVRMERKTAVLYAVLRELGPMTPADASARVNVLLEGRVPSKGARMAADSGQTLRRLRAQMTRAIEDRPDLTGYIPKVTGKTWKIPVDEPRVPGGPLSVEVVVTTLYDC